MDPEVKKELKTILILTAVRIVLIFVLQQVLRRMGEKALLKAQEEMFTKETVREEMPANKTYPVEDYKL